MTSPTKQLNPFELKAYVINIIKNFDSVNNEQKYEDIDFSLLDAQNDKKTLTRILYKELNNAKSSNETIIRILLQRYVKKEDLTKHLWTILKNSIASNEAKIVAVNILRDIDSNWSYEECGKYLDNEDELIEKDTRQLLKNAIKNPEVQIDFLDFMNSLNTQDKITLMESLGNDYEEDALANILIPVFLSNPYSQEGQCALNILGKSKSQLAYHALMSASEYAEGDILTSIKKNISTLKLSGIREDNTKIFYKELLKGTKPYIFCTTYPDGHGNQALIFTREKENSRIQFVAVVLDDYKGIRDCFGFNDISKFECEKIIERFCSEEEVLYIAPETMKTLLLNAENLSSQYPYEYVCWKNLLADIEPEELDITKTIQTSIEPTRITENDLLKLNQDSFVQHWFLEYGYSDEFDNMINFLNSKFQKAEYKIDLDEVINENLYKIFYPSELKVWNNRILKSIYLKLKTQKTADASLLYGLYSDDEKRGEFFKNILRRSIYEYYFGLKYDTELNQGKYSLNELEYIVNQIEKRWVENV